VLVAAVAAGGMPKAVAVALALAVPAFVVLLGVQRTRALLLCLVGVSFFSATQVKVGQVDATDLFMLAAIVVLVLGRDTAGDAPPLAPLPRTLLFGLGLVLLGGIIGSAFEPPSFSAVFHIVVIAPTKFLFLSPRYGELVRLVYGTIVIVLVVRAARLTATQMRHALTAFCLGATVSALWGVLHPGVFANRAVGLTSHPVYLGWISAFAAVVGVGLLLSPGRRSRAIGLATVVSGVAGIAVSGTRSGVLILFAGLIV
jgi:hypothetical protein